ncbi:hypothetical protein BH10BAC5_BH10BAC5_03290 [soil metagenome]
MERIKTKDSRMESLIALYDIHSKYLKNAVDGISDKDSLNRLETKAVNINWIVGSLVQERFELASNLGIEMKQNAYELFKDHKGIQDNIAYPEISSYMKDWDEITPILRELLVNVETGKLDESFEMMPDYKMTYIELYTFMSYRESSMIGQIALWRRLLGHKGMSYM